MRHLQLFIRGILSIPLFFGGLVFFVFAGMIFFPAGLMWVMSVLWVVCFKWVFKLIGVRVEVMEEIEPLSYGIFLMWFAACWMFVEEGKLPV